MKKDLIITLPLGENYGGIMQAYALQKFLSHIGRKCETTASSKRSYFKEIKDNNKVRGIFKKQLVLKSKNTDRDTRKFIQSRMEVVDFHEAKTKASKGDYHLLIAGSDQIWRNSYSYVPHNLFSFVRNKEVKRVSYAASFGKDNINDYSKRLVRKTRKLATRFEAISVRELSAIDVCKTNWGVTAEQHVDPTLLLKFDDYNWLIENPSTPLDEAKKGGIFAYVLDDSPMTNAIISRIETGLGAQSHTVIEGAFNGGRPLAPVEQWLRAFRDADFVVTDSFHGTVFSIIFKKKFISVGNRSRGITRFESLLDRFNLSDRLVTHESQIDSRLLNAKINWDDVDSERDHEIRRSISYFEAYNL